MAPPVPGARSQVLAGPAPRATSAEPTLSLSRGGAAEETCPGRGGAGRRTFRTRPNPGRTWAGPLFPRPRRAAWGDRGRSARVGVGAAPPRSPPSVGRSGKLAFPTHAVPKLAGSRRGPPLPSQRGLGVPCGRPRTFLAAPHLPQEGIAFSELSHLSNPSISPLQLPFPIFCHICPSPRRHVCLRKAPSHSPRAQGDRACLMSCRGGPEVPPAVLPPPSHRPVSVVVLTHWSNIG